MSDDAPLEEAEVVDTALDVPLDQGDDDGSVDEDVLDQAALDDAAWVVEDDLESLVAERDDYLAALRRVQADFENFRKQTIKRNTELIDRAAQGLVEKLLPVLDACDGALQHGHEDVKPIYEALMSVLEKEGLSVVYPAGEPFDPNQHEAVMHEPDDGEGGGEAVVTEVLRTGYLWRNRMLRPAMVKVKG